jgi:hypothetical protein
MARRQGSGKVRVAGTGPALVMSLPELPEEGSSIIVEVIVWGNGADWGPTSVTDNQGNAYTRAAKSNTSSFAQAAIYYCAGVGASSGTFTVTANPDNIGNTFLVGAIAEYGGAFEAVASSIASSPGSTAVAIGNGDALAEDSVLAGVFASPLNQSSITVAPTSPAWIEEFEELNFVSFIPGEGDTRTAPAGAARIAAWTLGTSALWTGVLAVFTPAEPSAPPDPDPTGGESFPPPIRRLRRAPHLYGGGGRFTIDNLRVELETGLGLSTGQGSDPELMFRQSLDGGKTWGNERRAKVGKLGNYGGIGARFWRLGQSRDRVVEISTSDPIPWRILGCSVNESD